MERIKAAYRLKPRKSFQTKSKVAAYIRGTLSLTGIMHPSRINSIKRKAKYKFDINSIPAKFIEPIKTKKICSRKIPALKDYINGKVPVSKMMPACKMNEIPTKTKRLQLFQQQNFYSSPWRKPLYPRSEIASKMSIKKQIMKHSDCKYQASESVAKKNLDEIKETSTDYSLTSELLLSSKNCDQCSLMSFETSKVKENESCSGVGIDCSWSNSCYESTDIANIQQEGQVQIEIIKREKDHSMSKLKSFLEEKDRIIRAHENIEKILLKQIVHLRKDRDKYRRAYEDIKNVHKISSERWLQFKLLNLD